MEIIVLVLLAACLFYGLIRFAEIAFLVLAVLLFVGLGVDWIIQKIKAIRKK